jgi:hypothetical protein
VAHDNRGVEDVHLIFYIPAPVNECITPARKAEFKMPPFPGWEGKAVVEMTTDCLGSAHCDVSVSLADERKLLETAISDPEPLTVLRASDSTEAEWIYKSPLVWLGSTNHLDRLDPGIAKRPSRFDRKFFFPDPNLQQRVKYCEFWQDKLKKGGNEDVKFPDELCLAIAKTTDGFSFAYIQEAFVAALVEMAAGREAAADGEIGKDTVAMDEWEFVEEEDEDRSANTDSPGGGDQRPDLDKYPLWRAIKKQVAILQKELNNRVAPRKSSFVTSISRYQ